MEECFECGNPATENHHVIPKSLGGSKTVPLCSVCHMKVHGLDKTRRAENHIENTKRGLDKHRGWEMFVVYQAIYLHDAENVKQIVEVLKNQFDYDISLSKARRLMGRIIETDKGYLQSFFDEEIDSDLSHVWRSEDALIRQNFWIEAIQQHLAENPSFTEEDNNDELQQQIFNQIDLKFRRYKQDKDKCQPPIK